MTKNNILDNEDSLNIVNKVQLNEKRGVKRRSSRVCIGGRKNGAKNYTLGDIEVLLHLVEGFLPANMEEWNLVAVKFNARTGALRQADGLKRKFESLTRSRKQNPEASIHRAKSLALRIQKKPSERRGLNYSPLNKHAAVAPLPLEIAEGGNVVKNVQTGIDTHNSRQYNGASPLLDNSSRISIENKIRELGHQVNLLKDENALLKTSLAESDQTIVQFRQDLEQCIKDNIMLKIQMQRDVLFKSEWHKYLAHQAK